MPPPPPARAGQPLPPAPLDPHPEPDVVRPLAELEATHPEDARRIRRRLAAQHPETPTP